MEAERRTKAQTSNAAVGHLDSFLAKMGVPRYALGLSRRGIALLALGVALMLLGQLWGTASGRRGAPGGAGEVNVARRTGAEKGVPASLPQETGGAGTIRAYEDALSRRLEEVLSHVRGVGKVVAYVSLKAGPRLEYAGNRNRSERKVVEEIPGGTKRSTTEETDNLALVLSRSTGFSTSSGSDRLFPSRELGPEISGVVVVADGASDPATASLLSKAVQTMLDVPAHRVVVLPRKVGE